MRVGQCILWGTCGLLVGSLICVRSFMLQLRFPAKDPVLEHVIQGVVNQPSYSNAYEKRAQFRSQVHILVGKANQIRVLQRHWWQWLKGIFWTTVAGVLAAGLFDAVKRRIQKAPSDSVS